MSNFHSKQLSRLKSVNTRKAENGSRDITIDFKDMIHKVSISGKVDRIVILRLQLSRYIYKTVSKYH